MTTVELHVPPRVQLKHYFEVLMKQFWIWMLGRKASDALLWSFDANEVYLNVDFWKQ